VTDASSTSRIYGGQLSSSALGESRHQVLNFHIGEDHGGLSSRHGLVKNRVSFTTLRVIHSASYVRLERYQCVYCSRMPTLMEYPTRRARRVRSVDGSSDHARSNRRAEASQLKFKPCSINFRRRTKSRKNSRRDHWFIRSRRHKSTSQRQIATFVRGAAVSVSFCFWGRQTCRDVDFRLCRRLRAT
jgi:hypothetical protein